MFTRQNAEHVGERMMDSALDNLVRDGYVAFACLLLSQEDVLTPVMLDRVDAEAKQTLGHMLRALSPHCKAIVILSEAWTLIDATEYDRSMPVSEHASRKEGVFVTVASKHGDLLLSTVFERDKEGKPVRPTRVTRAWQPLEGIVPTNFQGLFA